MKLFYLIPIITMAGFSSVASANNPYISTQQIVVTNNSQLSWDNMEIFTDFGASISASKFDDKQATFNVLIDPSGFDQFMIGAPVEGRGYIEYCTFYLNCGYSPSCKIGVWSTSNGASCTVSTDEKNSVTQISFNKT